MSWTGWAPPRGAAVPGRTGSPLMVRGSLIRGFAPAIALLGLALAPMGAAGQAVRAYLSADEVGVGRQFVLNVEVSGVRQLEEEPVVPDLSAFARYLGSGTSTSMQMSGGRTTVSLTVQYRFQAVTQGAHRIGPVEVAVNGRSFRTDPMTITVLDAPPHGATGGGDAGELITDDDVFVEAEVTKRRVYENEPIVVEYRIFTRVNVESYTITGLPAATGFWTEELEQSDSPEVEQVTRNGVQYASAVVRRVALFPTGIGSKVLDPLTLEARVRIRRRSRDLFGDLLDPFGNLDRSGLFGTLVPVTVATSPVSIEVMGLPSEARPESFSGHVGPLRVTTSVDRAEVPANEAVTFTVEYAGAGNLRSIPAPDIDFPAELEVFPPEAAVQAEEGGGSVQGSRRFDYVVIPRVPGEVVLPGVEVAAFDAGSRRYRVSGAEPIPLTVTGVGDEVGIGARLPTSVDAIREEIRFIHLGVPRLVRVGRSVFDTPVFWVVLLLPMFGALAALGLRGHWDRLEGDVAYARLRKAGRAARKRLGAAKRHASGDARAFYGEVAGAMTGFLADKLNLSEAGLVRDQLAKVQRERGVSQDLLDEVFDLLDECDRQRFAPSSSEARDPEAVLKRAKGLMARLDRELS